VNDGEKGLGRNAGDPPLPVLHGERVRVRGSANLKRLPCGMNGPVLLMTYTHAMLCFYQPLFLSIE
jgi:hypothetical protein